MDYNNALAAANAFDSKLQSDATAINPDYYPVVLLDRDYSRHVGRRLAQDDTLAFLKGDRTSAIEELYASAPFWLYINPELLRLLQPIVNEHMRLGIAAASGGVVPDLGWWSLFLLFAVWLTCE